MRSGYLSVSTSQDHSCAVSAGGSVQCWGENGNGQLGNGGTTSSKYPMPVTGLGSGVAYVGTSQRQTCALTSTGGVACWGYGADGELGNGTTGDSNVPVPVTSLGSGVQALAVGSALVCALTTAGDVLCWGYGFGSTPVTVMGLGSGVAAISAGYACACAATNAGAAMCWGVNAYGQLGDGTANDSLTTPVQVSGLTSGVTLLAGGEGYETCAVKSGAVMCWGEGIDGELGNGMVTSAGSNVGSTPVAVSSLGTVTSLSVGGYHACAVTTAGKFMCWGSNYSGQLGINTSTAESDVPVQVSGL
jgi:alpha-tubulin suppressor-like RCC1 family protein